MNDFVSDFWHWYIVIPSVLGIVAMVVLIRWMSGGTETKTPETMGHVWDEDLAEYNNPLPSWWLKMFYITLIFSAIYLVLFPGLGKFQGVLGWTSEGRYEREMTQADDEYKPLYTLYGRQELALLATDREAMKTGGRLFATYCTTCHGADARGAQGFPNLRDNDWLYGGDPQTIEQTILHGRQAAMPAWGDALGEAGVTQVAQYVLSLSGRSTDKDAAAAGKTRFEAMCVACHGADGTGNQALGAPNLTDGTWLYGGSPRTIEASIRMGRQGMMPAHADMLGAERVHLLAAYVYSLSRESEQH
jgi:cytochrome c oxidase cbb3-type subunit 3